MRSASQIEHFVTLFDSSYLPMGMALHDSLMTHGQPFRLWIICMDETIEEQLSRLALNYVMLIPLREVETAELLAVKTCRSRREYCWTLTPFSFQAVFDRDPGVERVTYLDADLFFFSSPMVLLHELDEFGKHVLITEHAYAPIHAKRWLKRSGRFCVQFLSVRRTAEADTVMRWWQERCLEWCFARYEEEKFGDQKYLDQWPELFGDKIHIILQKDKTLAPWNVKYYELMQNRRLEPVFFHFHRFRILGPKKGYLYIRYSIGREGLRLYDAYLTTISNVVNKLIKDNIPIIYTKRTVAMLIIMAWQTLRRRNYSRRIT